MKTNEEQEKNMPIGESVTFECKTDLQPKIVHSGPTTGIKIDTGFSWGDGVLQDDITTDEKDYVSIDLGTAAEYDREHDEIYKVAEIYRNAELAHRYEDVFRCIVAMIDQEVSETSAKVAAFDGNDTLFHYGDYYRGREWEAKTIREYIQRLFDDEIFRFHALAKLYGDK